jgi:hypothetical protein
MRRFLILSVSAFVFTWATTNVFAASPNLKGDYAFTGTAACMDSTTPFNPNFTPPDGTFGQSWAVLGIRTFNGDGTGTVKGSSMGITFPALHEGAGSDDFQFSFTYAVNSDGSWTSSIVGNVTGTVTSGPRATQTFTVANFPAQTGFSSQNNSTLTAATLTPTVETVTYSNGDVHYRICHRSRVLTKISN